MIIKLKPKLIDKIWGGDYFSSNLHYPSGSKCGEAWGISALENSESIVLNGPYKGKTLLELFSIERHLFGDYPKDDFPILVKLIDANQDLSIQVHPNNRYASKLNSLGKTECWYIVDKKENAKIIVGHNALSKIEITNVIENNMYETILKTFSANKGDLYDIPAGMIHAIGNGNVILEVQQSSDITYRFYDYNRLENGKLRELHINEALDVIKVPSPKMTHTGDTEYFKFQVVNVKGNYVSHTYGDYLYIIEGSSIINDTLVSKGDFIFIPSKLTYNVDNTIKVGHITIK